MDIKLNYIDKGQGQPFIFLHGNGEDHNVLNAQIEHFSKRFRVIAPDTRGHGASPRGRAPFTIKQFAEDLHDLMIGLEIDKAHILGFSDGGNIALSFAIKYGDMTDRLILNGANLNSSGIKRSYQLPIELGYAVLSLMSPFSSFVRRKKEMMDLMVNQPNIRPEDVRRVKNKTLVIAGSGDMVKREHTEHITKLLPNSRQIIIQGDHFIAVKQPTEFNYAVESFLRWQ